MDIKLRTYLIGISWFVVSLFSSALNDIIGKYAGLRLHPVEVSFFRFLFSMLALLPFIIYQGIETLRTGNPLVHIIRGVLLFLGMTSWIYGLTIVPVTTATVISFATPLFTLVLALFFLNERIIWQRWVVTVLGFCGIIITLQPNASDFNPEVLVFILASVSFAMLDIINKKFVIKESMLSMLFYSALVTTLVSSPAVLSFWQTPNITELALLFILGASGSLILFFLLKAFALVDATALAPYRYTELIVSAIAAYLVFREVPAKSTIYGALIIIPSTLFIIYSERKAMVEQD
jgi:S-adenosylmethionine uptake transporter